MQKKIDQNPRNFENREVQSTQKNTIKTSSKHVVCNFDNLLNLWAKSLTSFRRNSDNFKTWQTPIKSQILSPDTENILSREISLKAGNIFKKTGESAFKEILKFKSFKIFLCTQRL